MKPKELISLRPYVLGARVLFVGFCAFIRATIVTSILLMTHLKQHIVPRHVNQTEMMILQDF